MERPLSFSRREGKSPHLPSQALSQIGLICYLPFARPFALVTWFWGQSAIRNRVSFATSSHLPLATNFIVGCHGARRRSPPLLWAPLRGRGGKPVLCWARGRTPYPYPQQLRTLGANSTPTLDVPELHRVAARRRTWRIEPENRII